MKSLNIIVDNAMAAFWENVASNYPGYSGDLPPDVTLTFKEDCTSVVVRWIRGNDPANNANSVGHTKDDQCTVSEKYDECVVCGVGFSDNGCEFCGGRAYHLAGCHFSDQYFVAWEHSEKLWLHDLFAQGKVGVEL